MIFNFNYQKIADQTGNIMNVRGRGTLVAWDHHTMAQRDGIVQSK